MTHVDLVWPGLVLVLAIAAAMIVRTIATYADRAARARTRKIVDQAGHGRRGSDEPSDPPTRTVEGHDGVDVQDREGMR